MRNAPLETLLDFTEHGEECSARLRGYRAELPCTCGLGAAVEQARKTPTIAVFVRGGLVQDVCADMPCRVIVLDFDASDEEFAVRHTHPSGAEEFAYVGDYDAGYSAMRRDLPHVLCAIATADDAAHGADGPAEITREALNPTREEGGR